MFGSSIFKQLLKPVAKALKPIAEAADNRATAELTREFHPSLMFGMGKSPRIPEWKNPLHPQLHYGLPGFRSTIVHNQLDGVPIGIWHNLPEGMPIAGKPVFYVFPGRGAGAWVDKSQQFMGTSDPEKRLKILRAMAGKEAYVIAVHPRGTGLSQIAYQHETGNVIPPFNAKRVDHDMKAVIDFMEQRGINPEDMIGFGSSLGTVNTVRMAHHMKRPPAVFTLTGGTASMSGYIHALHAGTVNNGIRHWWGNPAGWRPLKHLHLGEAMPPEMLEKILKQRYINFDTLATMKGMDLGNTHVVIAHNGFDTFVPLSHVQKFKELEGHCGSFKFCDTLRDTRYTDEHTNWDVDHLIGQALEAFERSKLPRVNVPAASTHFQALVEKSNSIENHL